MPSFGKVPALIVSILTASYLLSTVNLSALAQEEFYFNEEFNEQRANNTLDSSKWNFYPNNTGCALATILESGGNLQLQQCNNKPQFPYIYTKPNPFPDGNYSMEIKFQYTKATFWGTGFALVDKAPENGKGFNYLFGVGLWQDKSTGTNMRISYDGGDVYTKSINVDPHIFKIEKEGQIYKIFFDGQLVYTSPKTTEQIKALWLGNPDNIPSGIPEWTNFKVDYVRIKQLPIVAPEPFLDLPWDYQGDKKTFNEAATSINSFFDHEYPLLSAGLAEPSSLINFFGEENANLRYSSHDGYDYGTPAKVNLGKSALAAATGSATFLGSCSPCGNAILIDHGNGYQTRYYHLQKDGLIASQSGETVEVTQGQQIGRVGYSGNVDPEGEKGSHLHFMVVHDKNNDGDFSDNIPDGIVDPFGWQSEEDDPWENYTFQHKGKEKSGVRSYYLFTNQLDNLNSILTSNAKVFNMGKTTLDVPSGATSENLNISMKSLPNFLNPNGLNSLGSTILIEAKNSAGNLITTFLKNFSLTINFSQIDLSRFNTNTLSIYSSPDGQNWSKEPTQVNLNDKTATTSINHLTHFALMAERADIVAPTTTSALEGTKGEGNNFRSDVKLILSSQDNADGLGVEYTAYGLEDGNWQPYSTPLTFSEEKNHKIYFYSEDKDGNIEEVKTVEFSIDKTPPEAKIYADHTDYKLKVVAQPEGSASLLKKTDPKDQVTYTLQDQAGNTLTIKAEVKEKDASNSFEGLSLRYNSDPEVILPKNSLNTSFILQPKPRASSVLRLANQSFENQDQGRYVIFADAFKNKTDINIFSGRNHDKQKKEGIVLIQLKTNQGKLEFSY